MCALQEQNNVAQLYNTTPLIHVQEIIACRHVYFKSEAVIMPNKRGTLDWFARLYICYKYIYYRRLKFETNWSVQLVTI
jgi:hypothetical protein